MAITTRQADDYAALPVIFLQSDNPLGNRLHALFSAERDYFLDSLKLDQTAPAAAMTLDQWSQSETFHSLCQHYGDHLYCNHPQMAREAKPLQSLWAQWYFGLIVPPMMMSLLLEPRALDCSPRHFHIEFHETGRPACYWLNVREDKDARYLNAHQRIDRLIQRHLQPVVAAIEQHGAINAKLIWNNTGYLMHWFLGNLQPLIDEQTRLTLEHALFFSRELLDGSDNPLYRTIIPREGAMQRRSCCQRYRVPDVQRCGDCTLKCA
ncbi:ferric iron reductase protein FhuF [Erwinia toletana]|uniref:Ferric iron reductase protein FhuF n=1 Tax=Winslowiella toletana TaxID=92490 RepID=A0ABS4PC31_9GAMM|nr:siderophore-iron reductase FhuF [Winslowiella toletana]MBP2169631.1 ferric iron reductase protein FhuF [Winslowiella toletana]